MTTFAVYATDKPGTGAQRQAVLAAHRAFLDTAPPRYGVRVLLSGPLTSDDGAEMTGSFFVLEAEDRGDTEAFFAHDPLASADIWAQVSISAVTLRQNNMGKS